MDVAYSQQENNRIPQKRSAANAEMDSTDYELTPNVIKSNVQSCLLNVSFVGSFTASQVCQKIVDPGLHVDGIGNIGLPLTTSDAMAIMESGHQAPFGRGSETVVDTSFRNTVELNPGQFRLRNPAWDGELQYIISKLMPTLGFRDESLHVEAQLYKLLLYDQGSLFKPHKE